MKKIKLFKSGFCEKLKLLLIPIGLLVTGLTSPVYAYYYLNGQTELTGNNWDWYNPSNSMGESNTITFMAKAEGTYHFKLYKYVDDGNKWGQPCGSIHSATGTGLVSYGQQEGSNGQCGAMWVQTSGVCNLTFTLSGTEQLDVEVTQCAYYIKYPWWGRDNWYWSGALSDCLDGGDFFTVGPYNGSNTQFCYGRKDSDGGADSNSSGGSDASTTTYHTTQGSPSSGTDCYFIYNPTNHTLDIRKPHNVTQPNYIYFDNSIGWTNNKIYVCIGHSKATPWLNVHETEAVANTKLRYTCNTSSWTDAAYYAMIGTGSGGWAGGEGKSYSSFVDAEVRSAVNWDYYNMDANHVYLINMASGSNGAPMSITDKSTGSSSLNSTQTIKYSISRNGGESYAEQTDGVTPAQITLSTYKFEDGTYNSVTSSSGSISGGQSSTYNTSVYAAYTGTTTLNYTGKRDGYTFIGWYNAASGGSEVSSPYYPTTSGSVFARFKAHRYNIEFNKNDAQYPSAPAATGTTTSLSNVVYDQSATLTSNGFSRAGYSFAGWATTPGGDVEYNNGVSVTNLTSEDGATVTLYAKWTPVALTFKADALTTAWGTATNWVTTSGANPGCVPTSGHDVTINGEATVSGSAVAKSVTIGDGGKVTIQPTGVLEVAGTVTNTDADKLIINTSSSNQGALICDLTSAPTATVNMTLNGSGFHLIASPTGGAKVSSTFAGSGIYTYAWEEGKGWDRRGYYDDFTGNEAILISGQTSCSFSGILSNACGGSTRYTAEPADESAQGINMLANPLTAPIRIADITISNSADGAVHLYNGSWIGKAPGSAGEAVIPAMQGYGVISKSGGGSVSFTYNTAVRGVSGKNAPLNAPKRVDSAILDHITLSVTTNDRKVDLELYENEQFTERIDVGWEAIYMEGDGRFGELYAVADKKMNILATPDLEGTVLGFVPGQAASYTISFEGDGKGYYLNDLDEQESTLIEEGNTYVFTPNESTNATRFVISKTPINKIITGNDAIFDGTKARKQMIDGILYIIRDGRIYDATGSLVK